MRAWLLLAVLAAGAGAAEGRMRAPPDIAPVLKNAPWYDQETDSWKRVVPKERDQLNAEREGEPSSFAYAMYGLVIGALGLLAVALWRLRGQTRAEDERARRAVARASLAALPFALPAEVDDVEAAYRQARAAGDRRSALIWLYAWQLARLDAVGAVRLMLGKTNRCYLGEVAARPRLADPLTATVLAFEATYFGRVDVAEADLQRLEVGHLELLAEAGTPSGRYGARR